MAKTSTRPIEQTLKRHLKKRNLNTLSGEEKNDYLSLNDPFESSFNIIRLLLASKQRQQVSAISFLLKLLR